MSIVSQGLGSDGSLLVTQGYGAEAAPPIADFTAIPTSGDASLSVQFTDTSTGSPTSWLWDFGDGGTSTAQNPLHVYSAAGTYTVSLTATNTHGSDQDVQPDLISVSAAPVPPVPPAPIGPTGLRESSGMQGGYLVPTQWGDNARASAVLYPRGTSDSPLFGSSSTDDSGMIRLRLMRRRKVVAAMVAFAMMGK